MRIATLCLLSLFCLLSGLTMEAQAADAVALAPALPSLARDVWISEIRGGAYLHDPTSPENGSVDLNLEVLSVKPFLPADPVLALLVPRFHLGGSLNTAGKTSHVYGGLTWTFDITSKLFVEGAFGVAFHNGDTGRYVPVGHAALGCTPLLREAGSLGYRLDANWTVMATVEHMSNAGLCNANRGLTNYGLKLGYIF
jgi:hypothetical protein